LNYLAHIFLSGNCSQLKIGNFIGDFVKGSQYNNYPTILSRGVVFHRAIDAFTDSHPVFRNTKTFLFPVFGRYSAILVDMYFDHFLARNFEKFTEGKSLVCFATSFYFSVLLNYRHLPPKLKRFIFHFVFTNRLKKYATLSGLKSSLDIMSQYKVRAINPDLTIEFLKANYDLLEENFNLFMPDVMKFSEDYRKFILFLD
jgi:acyl carrier protein phosphodiesterase